MENQYRDEMTIDLMDMVFYFLKKWKSLVAVLLVCAVLGGAYAAVQPAAGEVAEFVPKADVLKNMEQGCSKVQASGFLSESEDALKLAKQAGSEIRKTRRAQILRELEMCRVQNVKVLGMIAID